MPHSEAARPHRWLYFVLGWVFFGLGILGTLLPVIPGTPFIVLSAWAFSKSSPRFEAWLLHHRWFGPGIRRWRAYRVIPVSAKLFTILAMGVTLVVSAWSGRVPWWGLVAQGALVSAIAWFILRCPSRVPPGAPEVPEPPDT